MVELKTCPFCGLIPKIYKAPKARGDIEDGYKTNNEVYTVECRQNICDVQPNTRQYVIRSKAIEAWNNRV